MIAPVTAQHERGFTLIELMMAMAVFSFMLLIVLAGVINVVHLHNQALASNAAQDSARAAMNDMVQAVRDSSAQDLTNWFTAPPGLATRNDLCLNLSTGGQHYFYVDPATLILYEDGSCTAPHTTSVALTSAQQQVSNFTAILRTSGVNIEPEVDINLTVASNNGTTNAPGTACNPNNYDRTFCSVVKLNSGAVPRE